MKTPDLRKLHHAVTLAECGSYAQASERLHLSQSALTRSIQALEREFDLVVFDRSKRGVTPTRDGQEVLMRAQSLLTQASGLQQQVKQLKKGEKGQLAFGVGPAMPSLFLPDLLVRLNQKIPSLSVDVVVESIARLVELLRHEQIEFFVADIRQLSAADLHTFHTQELVTLSPGFFVRRHHPLVSAAAISVEALSQYPLLSPHHPRHLAARHPEHEREVLSRIHCNDLPTLRKMVLETDSILLGVEAMIRPGLEEGTMVQLPVLDARHREPSRIAWVSAVDRTVSAAAQLAHQQICQLLND